MGNSSLQQIQGEERARILREVDDHDELAGLSPIGNVTELSAARLREHVLAGELSLEQAVSAFQRNLIAERNAHLALTEVFHRRAAAQARKIDAMAAEQKKRLPLLGFVMCLKESILMQGTLSTNGMVLKRGRKVDEPTGFIEFLEAAGAVILAKSNITALSLAGDPTNNLYGTTIHPERVDRCTTGEACLVALRIVNSAIGGGSQGNARLAALTCRLFAFKATRDRWTGRVTSSISAGVENSASLPDPQQLVRAAVAPICRSAADLEILARAISDFSIGTGLCPPVPWRATGVPARIGFLKEFSFAPLPACARRAQITARAALEKFGVEVLDLELPRAEEFLLNGLAIYFKDGLTNHFLDPSNLKEPVHSGFERRLRLSRLSPYLAGHLKSVSPLHGKLIIEAHQLASSKNFDYLAQKQGQLVQAMISEFKAKKVEVALAPGFLPALRPEGSEHLFIYTFYTFLWNFLGFPVAAVPVTNVRKYEQCFSDPPEHDLSTCLNENLKKSRGLSVGAQVVGVPWKDEEVLKLSTHLQDLLILRAERLESFNEVQDYFKNRESARVLGSSSLEMLESSDPGSNRKKSNTPSLGDLQILEHDELEEAKLDLVERKSLKTDPRIEHLVTLKDPQRRKSEILYE